MEKGYFITIEGGEGTGKTSLIGRLADHIRSTGRKVVTTREPGGIEIAEQIRSVILNKANARMDARTEALLYAAARRQHLVEKIVPALELGEVVVCDRFIDSSLAYQGYARGLGLEEVWEINTFAIDTYMPHLTIYLDLDPRIGMERIGQDATREINRLDIEPLDFHERVRQGYQLLAERYSDRIVTIDASFSMEDVFLRVKQVVEQRLM